MSRSIHEVPDSATAQLTGSYVAEVRERISSDPAQT